MWEWLCDLDKNGNPVCPEFGYGTLADWIQAIVLALVIVGVASAIGNWQEKHPGVITRWLRRHGLLPPRKPGPSEADFRRSRIALTLMERVLASKARFRDKFRSIQRIMRRYHAIRRRHRK